MRAKAEAVTAGAKRAKAFVAGAAASAKRRAAPPGVDLRLPSGRSLLGDLRLLGDLWPSGERSPARRCPRRGEC